MGFGVAESFKITWKKKNFNKYLSDSSTSILKATIQWYLWDIVICLSKSHMKDPH